MQVSPTPLLSRRRACAVSVAAREAHLSKYLSGNSMATEGGKEGRSADERRQRQGEERGRC
jgi:hypothetical protein